MTMHPEVKEAWDWLMTTQPAIRRRATILVGEIKRLQRQINELSPAKDSTPMTVAERLDAGQQAREQVDHPPHYGGADNPYEAIKVIEAWELGFRLGNAVKYISRAGRKGDPVEDLKKARWYLDREISKMEEATNGSR